MQTILVVEDHNEARAAMVRIVTTAFRDSRVDDVPTIAKARASLQGTSYDLVVLDLGLPDGRGEDFIEEVLSHQPNAYVVISTIHDESDRLLSALQNGARGYLLKEQDPEHLIEEFRGLQRGKPPLAPAVTRRLLEFMRSDAGNVDRHILPAAFAGPDGLGDDPADEPATKQAVETLTEREREILVLLSKGFNRPEIAGILGISKHTVATHVAKIYGKLDISTRSEAAVIAEQHKLL